MNQIIVDASLSQVCVALIEDGKLAEIYMERKNDRRIAGNIYKGKITNVLPGMQAAFVDIGLKKNAFLFVKDAILPEQMGSQKDNKTSIKDIVKCGQDIVVQVIKEPIGTKGARITTHLTIPGRYLVLMPHNNYVGVSRRINKEKERKRLKNIMYNLKPENIGMIIRTEGIGKVEKDFEEDLEILLKIWNKIEKEKDLGFAPRIIYKDLDLLQRTVRDIFTRDIEEFVINDRVKYQCVLELLDIISPFLKERVKYFDKGIDIFEYYNVEKMLKDVVGKKVNLKSGGYIIIEQTEALTVIDVNTGKYVGRTDLQDTILKINKEAAEEITKQLRLRDIGGIIIVDFIDMNSPDEEKEVLKVLQKALDKDKNKTNVLGITKLGLLEMTRKKVRDCIDSFILKQCPYCKGTGSVLSEYMIVKKVEKIVRNIAFHTNAEAIAIELNPSVMSVFEEEDGFLIRELEKNSGLKIFIKEMNILHANDIKVKAYGKMEQIRKMIQK